MDTVQTASATGEGVAKATAQLVFPHGVANLTIRVDECRSTIRDSTR
jgi:hypothetical protein